MHFIYGKNITYLSIFDFHEKILMLFYNIFKLES